MTQLSDLFLAASLNSRGMGDTVFSASFDVLRRKDGRFVLNDIGMDPASLKRMSAEFGNEKAMTASLLEFSLKYTGFSHLDIFGKEAVLEGTFKELRRAARAKNSTNIIKKRQSLRSA